MEINGNMIIGDILDKDSGCAEIFHSVGMHCLGCPAARGESIAQACAAHSVNLLQLLEKLNNYFQSKN